MMELSCLNIDTLSKIQLAPDKMCAASLSIESLGAPGH